MSKYNSFVGGEYHYYKIKPKNSDKYFVGKCFGQIPRDAESISLFQYCLMAYGREATMKAMKELKRVWNRPGALIVENERDISKLPNANDPKFQELIN